MTSSSTSKRRFPGVVTRAIAACLVIVAVTLLVYVANVLAGMRAAAQTSGTITAAPLLAPVRVLRDSRDIPHIAASNDHDLFFAQGYVEASDRLFQMDLIRRFVYGRLAEVIGPAAIAADENARVAPIAEIVQAQWLAMNPTDRAIVQAYAEGVNAAMHREPLPVEFRLLLYRPELWRPQDSLAVGMSTVLDLIDRWDDVIRRDAVARATPGVALDDLYAITDPAYDSPIAGTAIAPVPPLQARARPDGGFVNGSVRDDMPAAGSNEWAVGAVHSRTGRALLANDPHLRLGIPGVWYLVDMASPRFHAAGASLPGTPGVILGHNANLAWGATNGTVVTEVVYRESLHSARTRVETFHVRFGRDARFTYYEGRHGFVAQVRGQTAFAVDWNAARVPRSPLEAIRQLDQAQNIAQARTALRTYPGPPQNFVLADSSGAVAYQLAGLIPHDPTWGLRVHPGNDPAYPYIPFASLPAVRSSNRAIVFTANNRMYGTGYPLRLSPSFEPPYRARRIEQQLRRTSLLAIPDLVRLQNDTLSLPELAIARAANAAIAHKRLAHDHTLAPYVEALAHWNGRFDPGSKGAPVAWELRRAAVSALARYNVGRLASVYQASAGNGDVVLLMRVLRDRPRGWWPRNDYDDLLVSALRTSVTAQGPRLLQPWGAYAGFTVVHSLAAMGFAFLNGASFAGDGDIFSLRVQTPTHSQSFRAVWDVGKWDAGGMVIPSGESGEPGSGHYTDQSATWLRGQLLPMPFSRAAVDADARASLTIDPAR